MELCDLETRYIVNEGLHNITNRGLLAMVEKQSYSMGEKITPIGIAFYIVPLIKFYVVHNRLNLNLVLLLTVFLQELYQLINRVVFHQLL